MLNDPVNFVKINSLLIFFIHFPILFRLIEPDFIIAYEPAMSVSDTNLHNGEKPISEITDAVST